MNLSKQEKEMVERWDIELLRYAEKIGTKSAPLKREYLKDFLLKEVRKAEKKGREEVIKEIMDELPIRGDRNTRLLENKLKSLINNK